MAASSSSSSSPPAAAPPVSGGGSGAGSAAEEDVELRDLVTQTLEAKGILGKIKAQLQASIFLTLEEQDSDTCKIPLMNEPLRDFLRTSEGGLLACLIREFLEFFGLDFTLSVYDPESFHGKEYTYPGRDGLIEKLQIDSNNGKKVPLLLEVLRTTQNSAKSVKRPDAVTAAPKVTVSAPPAPSLISLADLPPIAAKKVAEVLPEVEKKKKEDEPFKEKELSEKEDEYSQVFSDIDGQEDRSRSQSHSKRSDLMSAAGDKSGKSGASAAKSNDVYQKSASEVSSVEEDIEEDIEEMPEIDDLLDSASGGDDLTREETVSRSSGIGDYFEEVWHPSGIPVKKA